MLAFSVWYAAQGLGPRAFNVTSSVQAWTYNAQANTANKGWAVVMSSGTTSWQFASSETTASRAPILAVDWTAPAATAGTLGLSAASYRVNQNIGSATATATTKTESFVALGRACPLPESMTSQTYAGKTKP